MAIGPDALAVGLASLLRQFTRAGASGDDDVLALEGLAGSTGNRDLVAVSISLRESAPAMEKANLVFSFGCSNFLVLTKSLFY